ncbi:MAG: ATPase [Deltaproteobacteria bacterium]|nr:ATPase [Deltaproteobacteria bacterium]
MLFGDFGTTWTKLLDTSSGNRSVRSTRDLGGFCVDVATGHNASQRAPVFVNELLALVNGGIQLLGSGPWTLVDVGSRDIKAVVVDQGRPVRMEWNNSCGALTGFTLELLGRYFNLDFSKVKPSEHALAVTCGVLGMERLFDQVAAGQNVSEALAMFVRGMANLTHGFIGRPDSFYLSGGMCDNPLFLKSFPESVEIKQLGRYVLLEGLLAEHDPSR